MRILFVQKRYHSNQHYAMKGLLERGHKVGYFVQEIGPSENHNALVPKQIPYSDGFLLAERFCRSVFRYKLSRPRFGFPSFAKFYRQIKTFDPDVIIVKSCRMYSQIALIVAKLLRKPVVLYNQTRMNDIGELRKKNISKIRGIATRVGLRPHIVFTPASGLVSRNKPLRCGNTYHIPLVTELSPLTRVRSYRQEGTVKILAVGKYQDLPKKRHDLLIQAFHQLVKRSYTVSLTFVGSGTEQDPRLAYLRKKASDLNLQDRIEFRLNIPNDKMTQVYAAHDLFVLSSRWEGYGYSVLEAMASGLPVIASDGAGASDCIDNGVNGYIFKSDDLDSLTTAIERVIADHDLLEKMGQASREIVKSRYLPDVYHDRLMYLLQQEFGLVDSECSTKAEALLRASG